MTSIVIITLIVSLGYKITRKSIAKYTLRLIVLGFVYFLCSAIFIAEKLYTDDRQTSFAFSLMARAPFYTVSGISLGWIVKSLSKTITVLRKTKQVYKLRLFNNFYYAVVFISAILLCAIFLQFMLIIVKGMSSIYTSLASREIIPTSFSLIIFAITVTMRPTTKSRLLVYHDELRDEHTDSIVHEYNQYRASEMHHVENDNSK